MNGRSCGVSINWLAIEIAISIALAHEDELSDDKEAHSDNNERHKQTIDKYNNNNINIYISIYSILVLVLIVLVLIVLVLVLIVSA